MQDSVGAVELGVVPTPRDTAAVGGARRRRLETLLGSGVAVRVETVEALERRPSGKQPVIRSALTGAASGPALQAGPVG